MIEYNMLFPDDYPNGIYFEDNSYLFPCEIMERYHLVTQLKRQMGIVYFLGWFISWSKPDGDGCTTFCQPNKWIPFYELDCYKVAINISSIKVFDSDNDLIMILENTKRNLKLLKEIDTLSN